MSSNGRKAGRPAKQHKLLDDADSKFARALGSTDYHTREAGLAALTAWLAKKHDIDELDLLKLWKGIFYTFWHSDKHAVQVRAARQELWCAATQLAIACMAP